MKCEKCEKEIEHFLINVFQRDGSDAFEFSPFVECENNAVYVDTTQNWTGYELTEEEMLDTIECPHCRKFPFKDAEIQVYDVVRVVCFKEV